MQLYRLGTVLKSALHGFIADDMGTYSAALAYHVLFSLFPFVIFLVALLGFLDAPQFFEWLQGQASLVVPPTAMHEVDLVLGELQQPREGLLSVGAALALWAASAGMRALIHAINVAYDIEESRPAWKLFGMSVLYTAGAGFVLALAAALLGTGPVAIAWLARQLGLEQAFVLLWTLLRVPLAAALLAGVVTLLYHLAPNHHRSWRESVPGTSVVVVAWIFGSVVFDSYVSRFANYSAMYGSLGAVILLLSFFYLAAAVLLFGAELNAEVAKEGFRGQIFSK